MEVEISKVINYVEKIGKVKVETASLAAISKKMALLDLILFLSVQIRK